MLDATLPTDLTLGLDWRDKLAPGDIVTFRFPRTDRSIPARNTACLVLEIETVDAQRCAVLIPAQPSRRPSDTACIVSVGKRAELHAAGLDCPTQFAVEDRRRVPLIHTGFVRSCVTGSPVIGQLVGASGERLNAARGRLHALRDIRNAKNADADQLCSHQRAHRRQPVQERDVRIDQHQPGRPVSAPKTADARRAQ